MAFVTAALITGGIGAAAGLGGAYLQSKAAGDAADKQAGAAHEATMLQQRMYDQSRVDQEPWRQAGLGALGQMQDPSFQHTFGMSDFQKDPGYDFRMQEGQKALERSAAARGGLFSGGTGKALSRYGQDYASNEFQRARDNFNNDQSTRFGRLAQLAGYGTGAAAQNAASGQNYANQAGSNMMGAANAQGAAGIASANAYGGALSNLGRTAMDGAMMGSWMNRSQSALGTGLPKMAGQSYGSLSNLA